MEKLSDFLQKNWKLLSITSTFSTLAAIYLFQQNRQLVSQKKYDNNDKKEDETEKFAKGRIEEIHVYPVSSCRGIRVDSWKLTKRGLEYDREFMVIDADTKAKITGEPQFFRVSTSLKNIDNKKLATLECSYERRDENDPVDENLETLKIKLFPQQQEQNDNNSNILSIDRYGAITQTIDQGDTAADFFTKVLNQENNSNSNSASSSKTSLRKVRLVRVYDDKENEKESGRQPFSIVSMAGSGAKEHDRVNFQAFSSLHVVTRDALDFFQSKLDPELVESDDMYLTAERFRANLLVNGIKFPKEDEIATAEIRRCVLSCHNATTDCDTFSIIPLRFAKLCERCALPTIHPLLGIRNKEYEPTKTITRYHSGVNKFKSENSKSKPMFGSEFFHECEGVIKTGDYFVQTSKEKLLVKKN